MHSPITEAQNRDWKPAGGIALAPSRRRSLWLRLAPLASVKESGGGTNAELSSQRDAEIAKMHIEENI